MKPVPNVGRFGFEPAKAFEYVSDAVCVDSEEFIFMLAIASMESRKDSRTARRIKRGSDIRKHRIG